MSTFPEITEAAHENLSNAELAAKLRQMTEQGAMLNRHRSILYVAAARIEQAGATWSDEDHEPIDLVPAREDAPMDDYDTLHAAYVELIERIDAGSEFLTGGDPTLDVAHEWYEAFGQDIATAGHWMACRGYLANVCAAWAKAGADPAERIDTGLGWVYRAELLCNDRAMPRRMDKPYVIQTNANEYQVRLNPRAQHVFVTANAQGCEIESYNLADMQALADDLYERGYVVDREPYNSHPAVHPSHLPTDV